MKIRKKSYILLSLLYKLKKQTSQTVISLINLKIEKRAQYPKLSLSCKSRASCKRKTDEISHSQLLETETTFKKIATGDNSQIFVDTKQTINSELFS